MKITDEMRFPHPVLSHATADFLSGEFNFSFEVEERPSDGRLRLSYECDVTEPEIQGMASGDTARLGLFVTCLETYFNKLVLLTLGKGQLEFPGGLLNGRVVLRPVLWTERFLDKWRPANIDPEFGKDPMSIAPHKLLGLGDEFVINVGRDKLRPLETIFTLAVSEEMPEGRIGIDLEADRIRIIVGKKTHESINLYRGSTIGRPILLNGVYLPAVMEVLRGLASDRQLYEQRRWYRPFVAKCEHLSIDLSDPSLLEDAQKLLSDPYRRLMDQQEKIMS
jgi:hypothetical protein